MVQIVGKYQHVSNENFEEFLKSSGHPELAGPLLMSKPIVEITNNGDQWTIVITSDNKSSTSIFKLNEPFEEKLPSYDRKFQSVAVMEGNTFKVTTEVGDAKMFRVYEFTDAGMKVHLSTNKNDLKATRTYKRL
nr:PREDICTED: fatty acid-binding protein 12-like [Megachile rotundata]